jgi:poly(3-hydroxybutyrate) depolymerase
MASRQETAPPPSRRPWRAGLAGLALASSLVWATGTASATTPRAGGGDAAGQLTVGGRVRTYLVHRPPGFRAGLPVVLAFHGGGGTAAGMARISGLDAVADAHGFVVVYPQGVGNSWAGGKGDTPADAAGVSATPPGLGREQGFDDDHDTFNDDQPDRSGRS